MFRRGPPGLRPPRSLNTLGPAICNSLFQGAGEMWIDYAQKKTSSRFCTLRIRLTSLSTRQCKEKASKRTSREWLNENLGQKTLRHSSRNWIAFQMRARGRKILWWECCSTGNRPLITRICRKPGEILKLIFALLPGLTKSEGLSLPTRTCFLLIFRRSN